MGVAETGSRVDLPLSTLTRARVYVLIEALESDLRASLREWVLPYKSLEDILGPRFGLIQQRAGGAESADVLFEYVDFHDSFSLLNRHAGMLPQDLGAVVRDFTPRLDNFVAVRNRVMHGRPLEPDDAEIAARLCLDLVAAGMPLGRLSVVSRRVASDPTWNPVGENVSPPASESVLHNLPLPDFDETGLIGRRSENAQLLDMLLKRRPAVITLIGEGGIGKTALAVKVLYDLVDHPDCPYEGVLWTSLKREVLTAAGVEDIRHTVADLAGIASSLSTTLDADFEGTVEDLGDALHGLSVLIVLDNLESASSEEIVLLHDAMPDGVRFLFTSRVGLGQLERRIPIGPLSDRDAEFLFRKLAERRSLSHLARLPSASLSTYLERLRHSPLAIRWFVEAIDAGAQPEDLLRDQATLLEFCMASIHENLNSDSRQLLSVLYALDTPVGVNDLAVLSELSTDQLRLSIHELQRRSLVEVQGGAAGALQTYDLSAATREYLRTVAPPAREEIQRVVDKLGELRVSEEQRRKDERFHGPNPNAVAITGLHDRPIAHLLRTALRSSKRGDLDSARETLERARQLAPEYFEVPRVAAFIESSSQPTIADALYKEALSLAPEEHHAKVCYFYAGHLSNVLRDPSAALPLALKAHSAYDLPETALRLARVRMYLEEFAEAGVLLEDVLAGQVAERTKVIAQTDLTNLTRRRVETLAGRERKPLEAIRLGTRHCVETLARPDHGRADRRLIEETLRLAAETLRSATFVDSLNAVDSELQRLAEFIKGHAIDLAISQQATWIDRWAQQLRGRDDCSPSLREALTTVAEVAQGDVPASEGRSLGFVYSYSYRRGFGFLDLAASAQRAFFPRDGVPSPLDAVLLAPGVEVSFNLGQGDKGPIATDLRVEITEAERQMRLRGLTGRVCNRLANYLFVDESQTDVPVFCHQSAFIDEATWNRAGLDATLRFDVTHDSEGLRVIEGTAKVIAPAAEDDLSALLQGADQTTGDALLGRVNILPTCAKRYAELTGRKPSDAFEDLRERIRGTGRLSREPPAWLKRGPARFPPIAFVTIDDLLIVLVDGSAIQRYLPGRPLGAITVYRSP
jgi:cold shock CspA family protein/tetratricopeptide (TPR) repeat protein